jgi:hypothetical protein
MIMLGEPAPSTDKAGSGGVKLLAVNLVLMGNRGRLVPREVSGQRTGAGAANASVGLHYQARLLRSGHC